MLACDWSKTVMTMPQRSNFKTFLHKTARKILVFAQQYGWKNLFCNVIHPYKQLTFTDCPKCECYNFKTTLFLLKQFVFRFLFRDARAVLRYHLCSTFSLEKKLIFALFHYFVDTRMFEKKFVDTLKSLVCFIR